MLLALLAFPWEKALCLTPLPIRYRTATNPLPIRQLYTNDPPLLR